MAINVLDHDDRRIDDDAEIDGPNGQQVGRLAAREQHGEGEQQRQRDVDGHNQSAAHIAQEHEQDDRHQTHAQQQVLLHGLGGDVDQLGAVVVGVDLDAGQHPPGVLIEFPDLDFDIVQGGQRVLVLAQQDDALHLLRLIVPDRPAVGVVDLAAIGILLGLAVHDATLARLVGDDDAVPADVVGVLERAALGYILDANGMIVDRRDGDLANGADAAFVLAAQILDRDGGVVGVAEDFGSLHGILSAADEADATHGEKIGTEADVFAAGVGVGIGDGVLQL